LLALLVKRRADQETYAAMVGTTLVPEPFILSHVATGASPFIPDTLTDYYKRLAKQLGIATHFHELRHFAATTAIGSGADVRTVAGRLGHADASVTLRVYAHALEARDRDLASVLSSVVLGPRSQFAAAEAEATSP
jgi:integrase